MKLLVDGQEVEFKESIELVEENCIVGCHCNGGRHTEVMGDYRIYIDKESITVERTSDNEITSCSMNMDDLFSEMDLSIVFINHKEEIRSLSNLFS